VETVRNLEARTTNTAESFNGRVNKTCPPNSIFWKIVDSLRSFAKVVEKDIKSVRSGKLPERKSDSNGKAALKKMKEIKAITTFDMETEEMLEALARHSETDWCGRKTNKRFDDADAAMSLLQGVEDEV